MTDIKELLRLAVEDEPVTAFDLDRTITSGKRRLWRRRVAMAGAAVLSVATVAALVVGLQVQAQRHSEPATTEAPSSPGAVRAAQLTGIVSKALVLPDGMRQVPTKIMPMSFVPMKSPSGWNYQLFVDLADAQGSGNLEIAVTPHDTNPDCTSPDEPGLTCSHRTGPDGADLLVYQQNGPGGWSGTAVQRTLPDGTSITAWTSSLSWSQTTEGWTSTSVGWLEVPAGVKATRPAPPLPAERLIDVVTAIAK